MISQVRADRDDRERADASHRSSAGPRRARPTPRLVQPDGRGAPPGVGEHIDVVAPLLDRADGRQVPQGGIGDACHVGRGRTAGVWDGPEPLWGLGLRPVWLSHPLRTVGVMAAGPTPRRRRRSVVSALVSTRCWTAGMTPVGRGRGPPPADRSRGPGPAVPGRAGGAGRGDRPGRAPRGGRARVGEGDGPSRVRPVGGGGRAAGPGGQGVAAPARGALGVPGRADRWVPGGSHRPGARQPAGPRRVGGQRGVLRPRGGDEQLPRVQADGGRLGARRRPGRHPRRQPTRPTRTAT